MFCLLCSPGPDSSTWSRWRQTFGRRSWWSYTDRVQWAPESGHVEENREKERKVLLQQHFHTSALDNFRKMRPVHFPQSCFAKCVTCIYVSAMCHWRTRFAQSSTNSTVRQLHNAPNNSVFNEMNTFQQTGTMNLFVSSISNISAQNKNITLQDLQQTARGRPVIQKTQSVLTKQLVAHSARGSSAAHPVDTLTWLPSTL